VFQEEISTHTSNLHPDRIQAHTSPVINQRIQDQIRGSVEHYSRLGKTAIARRIEDLNHEWDVDRALMANFAVLGGATFALGIKKKRNFLFVFGSQLGFLLLHSLMGWCPPTTVLRRMGFRTHGEIEQEKRALEQLLESDHLQEQDFVHPGKTNR
jgi:hypothetical protein